MARDHSLGFSDEAPPVTEKTDRQAVANMTVRNIWTIWLIFDSIISVVWAARVIKQLPSLVQNLPLEAVQWRLA